MNQQLLIMSSKKRTLQLSVARHLAYWHGSRLLRNQLWLFLLIIITYSNSGMSQSIPITDVAFQNAEKVVYKVYYNWKFVWIPAGEVTFYVTEHDDHYELQVTGISYPSYDSFFKVRDYYTSRVDKDAFLPFNFRRDILEGKYQRYDSLSIDQENYQIEEHFGKTINATKAFNYELENTVHDMVSAIYYLRSLPKEILEGDEEIEISIFFDKEYFDINLYNKGLEKKKIKEIGKVNSRHFQVELISGYVFEEGDVMDIWVSDDSNNVPVQIESPISFGSVKVILKSFENLKHPSLLNDLY